MSVAARTVRLANWAIVLERFYVLPFVAGFPVLKCEFQRKQSGRMEMSHACRIAREIRRDFADRYVENDLETATKDTRMVPHVYKRLI
jgi:hypothetical protein